MKEVYTMLKDLCLGAITKDILSKAQYEFEKKYFFDDFLGNGDKDIFNRPVVSTYFLFKNGFFFKNVSTIMANSAF